MSDKSHLPMLATPINWDKVVYPCIVQPKLDGIRSLAFVENGSVRLQSRDGKPLYMEKIRKAVESLSLPDGTILDGELYAHGVDFNKLSGDVRRETQDERKDYIQYWVYDVMRGSGNLEQLSYLKRWAWLGDTIYGCGNVPIIPTGYDIANNENEVKQIVNELVQDGYEGAMIRTSNPGKATKKNPNPEVIQDYYQAAFYGHSRRSSFLMKVKTFEDAEAEIVDIEEEVDLAGNPKGRTGKFVMRTADGIEFRASGLTDEMKADSWDSPSKYIGQWATYKFFGVSETGVPRHPSFKALRPVGEPDGAV